MNDKNYTTKDVSKLLKVTTSRVCQMIEEGKFPGSYKFGNSWVVPKKSFDVYMGAVHTKIRERRS